MNDWNIKEAVETQENSALEREHGQEEKLFSQEELNRIIGERLAKERRQIMENVAAKQAELEEREFRLEACRKLEDAGFSGNILRILRCEELSELEEAIEILAEEVEKSIRTYKENLAKTAKTVSLIPPVGDFSSKDESARLRQAMGIE